MSSASFPFLIADLSWTDMLPALGILLIIIGLYAMMRKRKQKRGTHITAREQLGRMNQEKAVRGDIEQLMVELEQLTRRFSAQLDAKTIHLEKLLREADQRIGRLEKAQAGTMEAGAGENVVPPEADPASDLLSDTVDKVELHSQTTAAPPSRTASSYVEPVAKATGETAVKQMVYDLADQGFAPAQIARKLNEHIGKVELMLALRQG